MYGAASGFLGTDIFASILQQPCKAGVIVPFHTRETKAQELFKTAQPLNGMAGVGWGGEGCLEGGNEGIHGRKNGEHLSYFQK